MSVPETPSGPIDEPSASRIANSLLDLIEQAFYMSELNVCLQPELPVDAIAKLCQTEKFQELVYQIYDAVVPTYSESLQELRYMMFMRTCMDERIIHSNMKPSAETASEFPGVPVSLLPFVLDKVPVPDAKHPEFRLHKEANNVLCLFWEVIQDLQAEPLRLRELSTRKYYTFVMAMHDYFIEYDTYTSGQVTDMLSAARLE